MLPLAFDDSRARCEVCTLRVDPSDPCTDTDENSISVAVLISFSPISTSSYLIGVDRLRITGHISGGKVKCGEESVRTETQAVRMTESTSQKRTGAKASADAPGLGGVALQSGDRSEVKKELSFRTRMKRVTFLERCDGTSPEWVFTHGYDSDCLDGLERVLVRITADKHFHLVEGHFMAEPWRALTVVRKDGKKPKSLTTWMLRARAIRDGIGSSIYLTYKYGK